jgi:kynurenine formamidase
MAAPASSDADGSLATTSSSTSPLPAIDLTHPVGTNLTIQWPTANKFNFTIIYRGAVQDGVGAYHYESNDFEQSEHAGTHMDAPSHFAEGKWRTSEEDILVDFLLQLYA